MTVEMNYCQNQSIPRPAYEVALLKKELERVRSNHLPCNKARVSEESLANRLKMLEEEVGRQEKDGGNEND